MLKLRNNKRAGSENDFIVIDIGTQNIKTAICRHEGSKINILGYDRSAQDLSAMSKAVILDIEKVIDAVDISIGKSLSFAREKFKDVGKPNKCIIGLSGELVLGVSVTVDVEREDPYEPVTKSELQEIIKKVIGQTFESGKSGIAEEAGLETDMIDEAGTYIDSIYLDDQPIKNPVGFAGKDMLFKVFTTFAPSLQIQSAKNIANHFDLSLDRLMVEPYAIAKSITGLEDLGDGGVVVDIGAGTTDVAVIKNDEVQSIRMFGMGGRSLTRRIATTLSIDFEKAEELKINYSIGSLSESEVIEIKKIISDEIRLWIVGLEVALEDMDLEKYPSRFFLCGGGANLQDITQAIMEYSWNKELKFDKHPGVSLLLPNKIEDVFDLTRNVNSSIDIAPVALAKSIKII